MKERGSITKKHSLITFLAQPISVLPETTEVL
jgi:hypothetical protein